jgi:hypothetical protein
LILPFHLPSQCLYKTRTAIVPLCIKIISHYHNSSQTTTHNEDYPNVYKTTCGDPAQDTSQYNEWPCDTQSNNRYIRTNSHHCLMNRRGHRT